MSKVIMFIIAGFSVIVVLQYFIVSVHYKRHSKQKQVISRALIERLKE